MTSNMLSKLSYPIHPLEIHNTFAIMAAAQPIPRTAYLNFYDAHSVYFDSHIPNAAILTSK
jgi:hypothetical protein